MASGDLVMLGGGLSTVLEIFPGEADKGAARCYDSPPASPGALHPSSPFTGDDTGVLMCKRVVSRDESLINPPSLYDPP